VATTEVPPAIGRRMRAAWLLFGGIFTGVVLTTCGFGLMAVMSADSKTETDTQQQSYQHAVSRIELDIDTGDITLATGAAGQVSVERRLLWSTTRPGYEESWQGDTLRIRSPCETKGEFPGLGRRCSTSFSLRVPPDVAVEVIVRSGTIRVKDVVGPLRLSTQDGDVQVTNGSDRIWARTQRGEITATGLRCTQADARAESGNVNLEFATAPELVKAAAEFGDVDVAVPRLAQGAEGYQVRTEQHDDRNNVTIHDDPAARRLIFVSTPSGIVYVRYTSA
jgi:Putative adhesin